MSSLIISTARITPFEQCIRLDCYHKKIENRQRSKMYLRLLRQDLACDSSQGICQHRAFAVIAIYASLLSRSGHIAVSFSMLPMHLEG